MIWVHSQRHNNSNNSNSKTQIREVFQEEEPLQVKLLLVLLLQEELSLVESHLLVRKSQNMLEINLIFLSLEMQLLINNNNSSLRLKLTNMEGLLGKLPVLQLLLRLNLKINSKDLQHSMMPNSKINKILLRKKRRKDQDLQGVALKSYFKVKMKQMQMPMLTLKNIRKNCKIPSRFMKLSQQTKIFQGRKEQV